MSSPPCAISACASWGRLRAMVARADGDALLVQRRPDVLGSHTVYYKRQNARLLGGAD